MKTKSETKRMTNGPAIFLHTFELTKEIYGVTRNFPRPTRFVLGDKIDSLMTEFLLSLNSSTSKRADIKNYSHRHKTFTDLSFKLDELRILLRLAFEIKVISIGYYNNLLERVDQIGRELGGLIKYNLKQMEIAGGNPARRGK